MTLLMCNIYVRKRHKKDKFLESRNAFIQEFVPWVQYRPSLAKATGKEELKDFVVLRVVLRENLRIVETVYLIIRKFEMILEKLFLFMI